jgi:hypothetical protein
MAGNATKTFAFEKYGDVAAVRIRQCQKRTYAIVHMKDNFDSEEAIRGMN